MPAMSRLAECCSARRVARGISVVDARDVAEAAAVVLTGSGLEGRTYSPTGLRAPTYGDLCRLFAISCG
jgi:uncharacterized protein YbjT (DUF2867 family)